jgi:hypothetical protein
VRINGCDDLFDALPVQIAAETLKLRQKKHGVCVIHLSGRPSSAAARVAERFEGFEQRVELCRAPMLPIFKRFGRQ